MWTIFKVFIEFITVLLPFYALIPWSRAMWDPSSRTRDRNLIPCTGRQSQPLDRQGSPSNFNRLFFNDLTLSRGG